MGRTLSVFIDESGDFGAYETHAPFYLFSLVFHDQSMDLSEANRRLSDRLIYTRFPPSHCFHTMPIIRREMDYSSATVEERRKLLGYFVAFTRALPVSYTSIIVKKRKDGDAIALTSELTRKLANFLIVHFDFFKAYDRIIVYYDNGQIELTKVLVAVFNTLMPNVEFRKIEPAKYRLAQVADLCCTVELVSQKTEQNCLSHSEIVFFGSKKDMLKNYLLPVQRKRMDK